jgi:hypothetical protein
LLLKKNRTWFFLLSPRLRGALVYNFLLALSLLHPFTLCSTPPSPPGHHPLFYLQQFSRRPPRPRLRRNSSSSSRSAIPRPRSSISGNPPPFLPPYSPPHSPGPRHESRTRGVRRIALRVCPPPRARGPRAGVSLPDCDFFTDGVLFYRCIASLAAPMEEAPPRGPPPSWGTSRWCSPASSLASCPRTSTASGSPPCTPSGAWQRGRGHAPVDADAPASGRHRAQPPWPGSEPFHFSDCVGYTNTCGIGNWLVFSLLRRGRRLLLEGSFL